MTAYFPLFFFMPIIVKGINKLNEKEAKYLLVSMFVIFSFFGIIRDNYTNNGYHFLWLLIMFVVGVLVKKLCLFKKTNNFQLICIYIICVFITWLPMLIIRMGRLRNYISPTIVLSGITLLILFSRLKPNKKITSFLYPLTTGIYLFQNNSVVWDFIQNRFVFVSKMNSFLGIVFVILIALIIFIIGVLIDYTRVLIYKVLKIDKLSSLLSKFFISIFSKTSNLIYKYIE